MQKEGRAVKKGEAIRAKEDQDKTIRLLISSPPPPSLFHPEKSLRPHKKNKNKDDKIDRFFESRRDIDAAEGLDKPMNRPPRKAPAMFPSPPRTTTTKARSV